MSARELIRHAPADVVARALVLPPRVAQAGHEQIECRGTLAPTEKTHLLLGLLLLAAALAALCGLAFGRRFGALGALLAFRSLLALGQLALFELLALDLFRLGLDEDG